MVRGPMVIVSAEEVGRRVYIFVGLDSVWLEIGDVKDVSGVPKLGSEAELKVDILLASSVSYLTMSASVFVPRLTSDSRSERKEEEMGAEMSRSLAASVVYIYGCVAFRNSFADIVLAFNGSIRFDSHLSLSSSSAAFPSSFCSNSAAFSSQDRSEERRVGKECPV